MNYDDIRMLYPHEERRMSKITYIDGPLAGQTRDAPEWVHTEESQLIGGFDGDGNLVVYALTHYVNGTIEAHHCPPEAKDVPDAKATT